MRGSFILERLLKIPGLERGPQVNLYAIEIKSDFGFVQV
jgi:hypothetical protein